MNDSGYYGYTEGELVIVSGWDGTVGVQLEQGQAKKRKNHGPWNNKHRRYERIPKHLHQQRNQLGQNEKYKKPCITAVAQALRFEFGLKVMDIAKLLGIASQDVSRFTILESFRGIPWECRKHKAEAIEAARQLLQCQ